MKRFALFVISAFLLATAGAAYSQSLAELAKKEKERREKITAQNKVIRYQEAHKTASGTAAPSAQAQPASPKPAGEKPAKEGEAKPEKEAAPKLDPTATEPVDFNGKPESFWRKSAADARKKIKDFEDEGKTLVLKVADLRNQVAAESDGFKRQQLQRDLNDAIFFQNLNETRLTAAKDKLDELLADARKSGALPGWLDEKPATP